jgi:hypothetical protein
MTGHGRTEQGRTRQGRVVFNILMNWCSVFCFVLLRPVLCNFPLLFYFALTILFKSVLNLSCFVLYSFALFCPALPCFVLLWRALLYPALPCSAPLCLTLPYLVLPFTVVTVLHFFLLCRANDLQSIEIYLNLNFHYNSRIMYGKFALVNLTYVVFFFVFLNARKFLI